MSDLIAAARAAVLDRHRDAIEATIDCADAVAAEWDGPATTDRSAVVGPFEARLARAGLVERYRSVLIDAVDATGARSSRNPVAAPPYVTVASVGPVLRATLPIGRLVIAVEVFAVERDPTRYVRRGRGVESVLTVSLR